MRKWGNETFLSRASPNYVYMIPSQFGGCECLEIVNVWVVKDILRGMENEGTDWCIPPAFAMRAEKAAALLEVGIHKITLANMWFIFTTILKVLDTVTLDSE
jgi:hypothetical protein